MAHFTVRVTLVHRKRDIVVLELAIPINIELARARCVPRGREERISTLGAKEMLLVVCPLPKRRIIEGNEPLVDDGGFTLEASRGELLMIVKMTVRFTSMLIGRHMLEELIANCAPEASRMPSHIHRTYYSPYDGSSTATAE